MLLNTFTFHAPRTLSELMPLTKNLENFKLQAGGTFLLNALKLLKRNRVKTPDHVITLQKINELKGIERQADHLIVHSMTTIDDLFSNKDVEQSIPVLKLVCHNISTQSIRNMATIGGNLTCRYTWTEMPAVCIGLNAKLHFMDGDMNEEVMEAEDFFGKAAKTDKILTKIIFPIEPQASVVYRRVKKSQFVDIPQLSLLIKTTLNKKQLSNTRVAVNNCVEFAQRDAKLENFLNTQELTSKLPELALDHLNENIYDKRSNEYKKYIFRNSLKNALQELANTDS